eukprot:3525920-Rhodomonas_salina.3
MALFENEIGFHLRVETGGDRWEQVHVLRVDCMKRCLVPVPCARSVPCAKSVPCARSVPRAKSEPRGNSVPCANRYRPVHSARVGEPLVQ